MESPIPNLFCNFEPPITDAEAQKYIQLFEVIKTRNHFVQG